MQKSTMKRLTALSLATAFATLSPSAFATVIFDDGTTQGNYNALYVDGPGAGGPAGQTISNQFTATGGGTAGRLDFGLWVLQGATPIQISWSLGTTSFGSEIGGATKVHLTASDYSYLLTNTHGYDIYEVSLTGLTSGMMSMGGTYHLTLSDGNSSFKDHNVLWDVYSWGPTAAPAICSYALGGVYQKECGEGGEAFTIYAAVPEPSTYALLALGLGVVGVAARRRRAN